MDLIRYPVAVIGRTLAVWCTDCNPEPADDPIWTEDDAAEQVTELCLANLVAIAEEHEREHHADDQPAPRTPPPGSYWTDPAGKVWDLSCQYLDRHHRLWRISGIAEYGPVLKCIQLPNLRFLLAYVVDRHGPLVAIPPKVKPEPTHYGNGTHGGPAQHKGKRENCPAPECNDAIADEAEERDEDTRRVRVLLDSVNRLISRWAEADHSARADLWRGLVGAAEDAGDLFESRIAELDHRAAQLPDGGLATKPCHCYPRCAAEG